MPLLQWRKIRVLLTTLLLTGCLLTGCATVPPQPITGAAPTEALPAPLPEEPTATPAPNVGTTATILPDPTAQTAAVKSLVSTAEAPARVEFFYSGMPSLMGFADAPSATVYEYTMDALPASATLCWPQATASYYRYGAEKENMRLSKEQLLAHIAEPYFYLEADMTKQPARVKRAGMPVDTGEANMNEPIRSFYTAASLPAPAPLDGFGGTAAAVLASDPQALTILVTDLHELRADDGALLSALNEKGLEAGRSIGVVAVASEFSGYIPGVGANDTAFLWGAPPTGSLDYMMDFSDYLLGVSIDPLTRATASRPFYILCIGEQSAVNTYINTLTERLEREFSGSSVFALRSAVFGSGYVPEGYTIADNMRYLSGQGVTAIPEESAQGGVNLIELKASRETRYLEWEVTYKTHTADPRGLNLTEEDFTFMASAVAENGQETVLPHLTWSIADRSAGTVTLRLRLELPQGIVAQGSYSLQLIGSLAAPPELPGTDWMGQFGYDADGAQLYEMEQNAAAFDGSRTLFLSRLIDSLGKANIGRLGVASLGMVSIALTVYA